jgi:hypothetical protein
MIAFKTPEKSGVFLWSVNIKLKKYEDHVDYRSPGHALPTRVLRMAEILMSVYPSPIISKRKFLPCAVLIPGPMKRDPGYGTASKLFATPGTASRCSKLELLDPFEPLLK